MMKLRQIVGAAASVAASFFVPNLVSADEIVLTLHDNELTITGEFAGFSNNAYIIEKDGEKLFVPAKHVNCQGDDCLVFEVVEEEIALASN